MKRREVTNGIPSTTDPSAASNQTTTTGATFEEKIVRVRRPELALTVSAVYRAVELRAKTEAQFAIQYQKMNAAGGNFVPDMWGP